MKNNFVDFTEWLQGELNQRDWTQADLADRAGIGRSSLSMVMSKKRQPGKDMCRAIAATLQLPEEVVFRHAGLLSPRAETNEKIDTLCHLAAQLDETDQDFIAEQMRALIARARDRDIVEEFAREMTRLAPPERAEVYRKLLTRLGAIIPRSGD